MSREPLRLAVFASGGGSNFQSILDAADRGLPVRPVLCVTNRPDAGALVRAARHGVPSMVADPARSPEEHADELIAFLQAYDVQFIALAGYLRRIPERVVQAYHGRMLNVHPALLPAFGGRGMYGLRVHQAVLDYGVRWTGATVHLVDEAYDTGPIVLQEPVPVHPDDTAERLAARVLEVEHRLFPEALRLFAEDRIRVDGRRVQILPPHPDAAPSH